MSREQIALTRKMRDEVEMELKSHDKGEIALSRKEYDDKEEQLDDLNKILDEVIRKGGKPATIKDAHDKRVRHMGMNIERVIKRVTCAELEKDPSYKRTRTVTKDDIDTEKTPLAYHLFKCIPRYEKIKCYCYQPDIEISWDA